MKIMKLFGILFFALGFTQCASQKFENKPPFTITSAVYTNISGGMPGNNSVDLRLTFSTSKEIEFDQLFFINRTTKAVLETKGKVQYIIGRYNTSPKNSKYDLELHGDSKKEYGNKPSSESFPFKLKENEAVLSYKDGNKTKYVKIENIKKGKRIFMQ
ncbi:hypothetical protein [Tenacibaculum sp. MAR_2009_124]|uniref:hypothetical protein n=1 Tax=Tenacibaculum sp. MAR_2009_124 TaxID=1250059 RepID=UPI00115FBF31|nr:hypothetical protein [Tenacibaculum sp. MAR_2009_124]